MEESEILKRLVVEEKDTVKELGKLVEMAAEFFKIEKPTGRIIFQNFGTLSDQKRISIVLLGKYFAGKLGMLEKTDLGISEIAKEIGRPMTALSGPLKDLTDKGLVEKLPTRTYRIAYHRLPEIFDKVLKSKK